MGLPENRKTVPDPRSKIGPFEVLLGDIQACKTKRTCPTLTTRQFYFEPNSRTALTWEERGCFLDPMDYRVMFVCESPGPSAGKGYAADLKPCFSDSPRDRRFQDARKKYALANCYITNTVKCGVRKGAKHSLNEIEACRTFLLREINLIQPMIIVGVGGNAFQTLRTEILKHLPTAPILFQITHYSSRRNPWDSWDNEFPELLRLLDRLRPPNRWAI
jgi:uracil-DNA glycosylase